MPKRPRGGGERPQPLSVREGQARVAQVAPKGRLGAARSQIHALVTSRTGAAGGIPEGRSTSAQPGDDASTRRSIAMENSAAALLAEGGWRIKQNPSPDEVMRANEVSGDRVDPGKKPDYLLEGRVFDCYSPTNPHKGVRGIWTEVEAKVLSSQTQRAVVNLEYWRGDLGALRKQFTDWPIPGLKEVKAITADGDIIQIDLPSTGQ